MPEGDTEADTDTESRTESGPGSDTAGGPAQAPYRAEAVRDGGQWHLVVRSLDDHPDRGEVDALVVTVTPADPEDGGLPAKPEDDGFPAEELDGKLRECGFARDGRWARRGERWTAPCRMPDARAAPPSPPVPQ